ncbi:MAG: MFS transporter [Thermomicrobiales bacterium]|nr:MFS transporter [Thermomicrobiales bacterium]
MSAYLRRVLSFSFDLKLFLLYNLLANIGFGTIELVFNFYLIELGHREDFIGEWRAVQTVSMAVSAMTIGFWINRFGPWRTIVAGFAVFSLASVLLGIAEQTWLLYLLGVLFGAGLSTLFNPIMPFVMEYSNADERQYVSAISFSLISFSMMIGSLVGGFYPSAVARIIPAIEVGSLQAYRAAIITGSLIAALGLIPLLMMGKPRQGWSRPDSRAEAASESTETRKRVRMDVAMFVTVAALMSIGVGMVQPFYNVFLKDLGASDNQVGFIFALGGLVAAMIGLAAPLMANRMGSLNAVLLLRMAIIPFYLAIIFAPNIGFAVMAFLVRQASISIAWPIDSTFISEILPPRARSGVFGWRSAAWNGGFALASYLGGRIIVNRGYDPTFVSLVIFTAISVGLFWVYYSRHPAVTSGAVPSALPQSRRGAIAETSA